MRWFKPGSLKTQTIVIFTAINILLIVLLARFSYLFVNNLYLAQFQEQLQTSLQVIDAELDHELLNLLTPQNQTLAGQYFQQTLSQLDSLFDLNNLFLFNQDWQILSALQRDDAISGLLVNKASLQRLKAGQTHVSQPFLGEEGQWYLWAFKRLNSKHFIGLRANANRLAEINQLGNKFLFFGLVALFLTLLAAIFTARSMHAPVKALTDFSQKIGQGDFHAQPPESRLKEINQLSQALNQMRQALQQRDQEKEQMLAQIAHELRNPLGSIELLIGLVQDDLPADHADQAYLQKVLTEVRHLKEQINEFLHYSRPRPPEKTAVDLKELTEELKEHFLPQLEEKQVQILTQFKQSTFNFDREHLKQILSNLVLNSLQAMDGQPGLIMLRCQNNLLEIEDNGPGITPEVRDQIFQPFFTTKSSGVGLGLTICQRLCRLNNAQIGLAESAAQSNTFFIKLNKESS